MWLKHEQPCGSVLRPRAYDPARPICLDFGGPLCAAFLPPWYGVWPLWNEGLNVLIARWGKVRVIFLDFMAGFGERSSGFYDLPWGSGILVTMAWLKGEWDWETREQDKVREKFCFWGLPFGVSYSELQHCTHTHTHRHIHRHTQSQPEDSSVIIVGKTLEAFLLFLLKVQWDQYGQLSTLLGCSRDIN